MTTVTQSARISYVVMGVALFLIAWLHLGVLVLTTLFGYFALGKFQFKRGKYLAVAIYLVVVALAGYGLVFFSHQAYIALPKIAEATIPAVVESAERHNIELPFTDYASAKAAALAEARESIANIGRQVRNAAYAFAQLIAGLVVALSLFLNAKWGTEFEPGESPDSIYMTVVRELATRFRTFYASFSRVIGAQILISAINTGLTAAFLCWYGYPHIAVLVGLTFMCGLLPIVGNLISNTFIIGVSFTISPEMAVFALVFLVVIHKLEYFLNSKIVGDRIKNPMWLTLIGLVVGEKLMGIPGMILAPVVLHYIKVEASQRKLSDPAKANEGQPANR
jgi:predicted PurR-regulated permease PerM